MDFKSDENRFEWMIDLETLSLGPKTVSQLHCVHVCGVSVLRLRMRCMRTATSVYAKFEWFCRARGQKKFNAAIE